MDLSVLATDPSPVSDQTRAMILDTLKSVLESPLFRKSRRYPALLKYSVAHTLSGDHVLLKERVIGAEVFGRPADYDTNEDPVVRIAAGEVRKRLIQYFFEHPDSPARIDLPPGSYVAEFHVMDEEMRAPAVTRRPVEDPELYNTLYPRKSFEPGILPEPDTRRQPGMRMRWTLLCAILLFAVSSVGWWLHRRSEMRSQFWQPMLQSGQQPLILIGLRPSQPEPDDAAKEQIPGEASVPKFRVVMSSTIAAADICGVLGRFGKACELSAAPTVPFTDIRNKPLILVGAYDNPWTDRLLEPLRFHFYRAPETKQSSRRFRYIVDRNVAVDHSPWVIDSDVPSAQRTNDYSIIARFHSDITDNSVAVAAGIGTYGTRSAAEYVISPDKMAAILALAPKGWKGFNFEAVLQTDVVQGHSGHTRVVATQFW